MACTLRPSQQVHGKLYDSSGISLPYLSLSPSLPLSLSPSLPLSLSPLSPSPPLPLSLWLHLLITVQIFLLAHTHQYLMHETVFFNNPTLYLCFQKLYELISHLLEVLLLSFSLIYLFSSSSLPLLSLFFPPSSPLFFPSPLPCFPPLLSALSHFMHQILASVVNEAEWADTALGPLGLVVAQIKFSAAKLVSVQYSTPGLFELL